MHGHVTAEFSVSSITGSVDAEFVRDGDTYYFVLHKFPILPGMPPALSSLRDKWVKITQAEILAYSATSSPNYSSGQVGDFKENQRLAIENAKTMALFVDKAKVLQFKSLPTLDTINGTRAYRYDFGVSRDGVLKLIQEFIAKNGEKIPDAAKLAPIIQTPEFAQMLEYMNRNGEMSLWFDVKDASLVKGVANLRIAPGGTNEFRNKEIDFTLTSDLKPVSTPPVIEIPKEALPFADVVASFAPTIELPLPKPLTGKK